MSHRPTARIIRTTAEKFQQSQGLTNWADRENMKAASKAINEMTADNTTLEELESAALTAFSQRMSAKSEQSALRKQWDEIQELLPLDSHVLRGEFRTTEDLSNASASKKVSIKTKINTHSHGIYLMHSVDEIKTITSIPAQKVKNILQRLFRKGKKTKFKFVSLDTSDFYAFIINNIKLLKQDFREIMAQESGKQLSFAGQAKTATFTIPESELYKFSVVKKIKPMTKNAYAGYTNEFVTSETRKSTPERLFEQFCERCDAVEWVYKNGDAGQQYFSIVYQDGFSGKQWLFYPDYIVKLTNGDVWIIETKGGMQGGFTKNIDIQVENKFKAFKDYARRYNILWGFVRDIDEELYLCNTEYTEEMNGDNWMPLESVLK